MSTEEPYSILSTKSMARPPLYNGYYERFYCIQLPVGKYQLQDLLFVDGIYVGLDIKLDSEFKVQPDAVTYLGSLKGSNKDMANYIVAKKVQMMINLVDEYDLTKKRIKTQCPWLDGFELKKSLMSNFSKSILPKASLDKVETPIDYNLEGKQAVDAVQSENKSDIFGKWNVYKSGEYKSEQ